MKAYTIQIESSVVSKNSMCDDLFEQRFHQCR